MHRLPQARRLAHDKLVAHLSPYDYSLIKVAPSIWTYNTLKTIFTLVVNDFGIKNLSM